VRHQEARLRQIDSTALWHPFTQMACYADEAPPPPVIVRAEGNWLVDAAGKRYLDANAGYWCLALGCRPRAVERAVQAQLKKFSHSTLLGLSHLPAIKLAERLTALAGPPLDHVFFADSGSEAVEVALKMAYQFHVHSGHPERSEFLALGEAYHGDTLGAVAVGGIELFHATFRPLLFPVRRVPPPHCYRCPWKEKGDIHVFASPWGAVFFRDSKPAPYSHHCHPAKNMNVPCLCARALEREIARHHATLAALVIEPFVLGPGGIIPQPEGYLERVVDAARKHGVLVIFDEVAVGMGRLGTVFAFEQLQSRDSQSRDRKGADRLLTRAARKQHAAREQKLKPDLVCLAKGLTAGLLPLSAVLASDQIYRAFLGTYAQQRTFFHGHTFTGSALGCAAALAALDRIAAPAFLGKLREKTIPAFWRALAPLSGHPHIGDLRGRGLMAGVELIKDKARGLDYPWAERYGHRVVLAARKRGVNTRAIGNIVLAVPPLTIKPAEIELLGRALYESVEEATR